MKKLWKWVVKPALALTGVGALGVLAAVAATENFPEEG